MRVGILGCGKIALKLADTIIRTEGVSLEAVAARDLARANEFAARFSVGKAYGSYEELCKDPDVDLVYVATVTNLHKEHMLLAIRYGKAVLCEKSFTVNAHEAEEVFAAADKAGVLVAEAIWTRYMPCRAMISDIIRSGKIGKVTTISANLCYNIIDKERIVEPALGGGALLDIGVYPINFALMVAEGCTIDRIAGTAVINELGADIADNISFIFSDGSQASIFADARTVSDRRGIIYGTTGFIEVENINNPSKLRIYSPECPPVLLEEIDVPPRISGYEYELLSCAAALKAGRTEVPEMPHSETLRVMRIMDSLRSAWGVKLGSEL